jgi:hypothetical protein
MEFNSSGNKRSLPPSLMSPKLGAFGGFMTISKKYTKARGNVPFTFHYQNNCSHNFNKQKQEGEEPQLTPHLETKKNWKVFTRCKRWCVQVIFCWIFIKWRLCG